MKKTLVVIITLFLLVGSIWPQKKQVIIGTQNNAIGLILDIDNDLSTIFTSGLSNSLLAIHYSFYSNEKKLLQQEIKQVYQDYYTIKTYEVSKDQNRLILLEITTVNLIELQSFLSKQKIPGPIRITIK